MKGGKSMKDSPLINKSKIFALEVLKFAMNYEQLNAKVF